VFVLLYLLAYKCPKTLGNTGLSGILCFDEKCFATRNVKIAKRISCKWFTSNFSNASKELN
jgi:hypothetical protein